MEQSSRKRGIDGTPKSNENPPDVPQNATSSKIHQEAVTSQTQSTHEPRSKRQKTQLVALLRQILQELEEEEKSQTNPTSWVDTVNQIVEEGRAFFDQSLPNQDLFSLIFWNQIQALEKLEADIGKAHKALLDLYNDGDWANACDVWHMTKSVIELLSKANSDDTEGCKKVQELVAREF